MNIQGEALALLHIRCQVNESFLAIVQGLRLVIIQFDIFAGVKSIHLISGLGILDLVLCYLNIKIYLLFCANMGTLLIL